jgi:hypothetical protein
MTQNDIIALINEIQTAADYPATKMNPLLNNILSAAYGPMYIGSVPPGNTIDENAGYRPGSVGYDTVTKRYYICQSAIAGNAVWILIPADSSYQVAAYTTTAQQVVCSVNTTVVKCSNDSVGGNLGCSLKLPANPYIGRTVLVYFDDSIITFTVRDSSGTAVVGASSLTIPDGQQYTFTYSGTAWEIVGVNNTTAGTLSGVDVANTGGVVTTDTNKLTFLGAGATVANDGSGGTNITINPLSGIDIKEGGTTVKTAAQFVNFNADNFDVTVDGVGASVAFNQRIEVKKNTAAISSQATGFDFKGPLFDSVAMNGTIAELTMNGAKTWINPTSAAIPSANDDISDGYSTGSIGRNTGSLLRTYVCRSNALGAAIWDQITLDYKTEQLSVVSGGSYGLNAPTTFVKLLGSSTVSSVTLNAPYYPYEGKTLTVYATTTAGTFNAVVLSSPFGNVTALTPGAKIANVTFVCINPSTLQWIEISRSYI